MGGTILEAQNRASGQIVTDDAYAIISMMNKNHKGYKA